jgi:hypothetical protein
MEGLSDMQNEKGSTDGACVRRRNWEREVEVV